MHIFFSISDLQHGNIKLEKSIKMSASSRDGYEIYAAVGMIVIIQDIEVDMLAAGGVTLTSTKYNYCEARWKQTGL